MRQARAPKDGFAILRGRASFFVDTHTRTRKEMVKRLGDFWLAAHRRCVSRTLRDHVLLLSSLLAIGAPVWSFVARHPRQYALAMVALVATWVMIEFYSFGCECFESQYLSKVLRTGRIRNAANSLLTLLPVALGAAPHPGPVLLYFAGVLAMYLRAVEGSGARLWAMLVLDMGISRLLAMTAFWMFQAWQADSFWGIVGAAGPAIAVIAGVIGFCVVRSPNPWLKVLRMIVRYQTHDEVVRRVSERVMPRPSRARQRRAQKRRKARRRQR
jgi:hypothetical protein